MGKVTVVAKVQNLEDLYKVDQGTIGPEDVRQVEIADALVDTGATNLALPSQLVRELGLRPTRTRRVRTSAGPRTAQVYGAVRLTIQGRDCVSDVIELPEDCPALIGQISLELLDFVVDPNSQSVIGNPAHGGEHIVELY